MVARKDQPEMFEAFKRAEEARKQQALQALGQKPAAGGSVGPKPVAGAGAGPRPVPAKPKPAGEAEGVKTPAPAGPAVTAPKPTTDAKKAGVGILAPTRGEQRTWNPPGKPQGEAVYIPLGQRSQVVLSMSWGWAAGIVAGVLVLMLIMLVIGRMTAGLGEPASPPVTPKPEANVRMPAPTTTTMVTPTTAVNQPPVPTASSTAGAIVYWVQVLTVNDTAAGLKALVSSRESLEGKGYRCEARKRGSNLVLLAGSYATQNEAEAAKDRIRRLDQAYDSSYVVRSQAGN